MSKTVTYNGKEFDHTSTLFDQMHADGLERDQAIITAVQAGLTLNTATQHYAKWAKENGLTRTIVSHKSEALDYLTDEYGGGLTLEQLREALPVLVEKFDVAESTARDYAKAYCKDSGILYPAESPREIIFNWFLVNQGCSKEQFIEFAVGELKRSESNANEYWKGYELHMFLVDAAQ